VSARYSINDISSQQGTQARNAAIPQDLKNLHQWARWIKGSRDKMPAHLDESVMNWSNRSYWLTFDEVARYSQIGYFHTLESGIVGIDFDGCIDENGVIHPLVLGWLGHTYAELSPSRRGIKIYIKGTIPDGKAIINTDVPWRDPAKDPKEDHAGIEIYAQKRFFTVTGSIVPGCPSEINEAPAVLNDILVHFAKPPKPKRKESPAPAIGTWDFNAWVLRHLEVEEQLADGFIITCPWAHEHTTPGDTARIWEGPPHTFSCFHAHCDGREWSDVRLKHEPTAYDKRDAWSNTTSYNPGQDSSNGNGNKEAATGLPCVILGGQLRESRDESLEHLGKSEEQEPIIFVQSDRLVQIGRDKEHKAVIMHMGIAEIKNALTKACDFFTLRKKGDEVELKPASPPKEVAEAILALSPSKWPFKTLEAIVETPVIRPDGTILQKPGYDEQTKLYYAPHKDMHTCTVPESPSEEEVQNARAVLEDVIIEFPFVDQSDMANMLALMITPIIRPAIKRHVPLALLDAPKQASGKGLLADVVSIVATGEPASILTAPGNDEEWRKEITSILMKGSTIIAIDNLPGRLQSSKLDAVLTADWWADRLLGGNTMVRVRQRAVWLATGNNIKVGGDLARRCYRIRIDPKMSKPWTRAGFKYEDLATHCSEHRSQIVAAILTLVRAWFVAGCPQDKSILPMATFTGWARMAGSILSFAGIEGFLGNLNKLYDEMDVENAQWALFLQAWQDMFGEKAIPVKMLIAALADEKENDTPSQNTFDDLNESSTGGAEKSTGGALAEFLPDNLQTALKEKPKSFNIILGKALESKREACFGERDLRLEKVKDTDAKQWTWKVVTGGTGGAHNPSARKNYSSASNAENEKDEENVKYNLGMDDYPYHPYEESTQNGKYATNQGEKTTEPLADTHQENVFQEQPPVNQNRPPVNLDALPEIARRLYVELVGSSFNDRPSTIYRGEYLSLSDFYSRLAADLASSNEATYQTALAILQKKLAEVGS